MTSPSSAPAQPGKKQRTRGSDFSDRQIYAAVRDQRRVTIGGYEGLVIGMDDYHLGLVTIERGETVLIHKTADPIVIGESVADVLKYRAARDAARPFRDWVLRNVFNQQS